ncbi:MAG: TIGR03619 family F420-dependent LLM class oxidoreductase [Halieaceae bacterium]|nr:TIGR03619 family F420-dependent LLM class oxidoreductase [Halieaceae bacterium]MCP4466149.1 TIGR03619 family F420-dependent LLM class oxidoreductase [Halieaceae bacterium]MCP4843153.1 TIGR03619 family F420-dependent LLM class oxidoreductase [Halieaceae bacterium]MDG2410576.1 TIGR03619 family F420-dependent LLM class oxidoreductase [Halioglobus sp.]
MHLGFSSMNTADDPAPDHLAQTLEEAGFESLWYGEHSHIPVSRLTPYPPGGELPEPYKKMMDPYVSLMAAAQATSRLKLGTGIALLMERELMSQTKTIATLDRLSNGRLLIGCGVGWNREEFENATQLPFDRRYLGMKETVLAQRKLLTDAEPEFHGELIDFDPVWFEPKAMRPGGPAVIFGAMGPLGLKHAAQWADGWMPVDVALPDIENDVKSFRQMVADNGRDPASVEITLVVMAPVTADLLKSYRDIGIDRCNIGVGMENWDRPDIVIPMIEEFSKLIPEL